MLRLSERVPPNYFAQETPRPFPYDVLPDMLNNHVLRPAVRGLLNPQIVVGLATLLIFSLINAPGLLNIFPLALIVWRLSRGLMHIQRRVRAEISLLRNGLTVRAHVLRLRAHRTVLGDIDGACLDCALAVAPRRTYIGSIWLSDGAEAAEISRRGYVYVICLLQAPGSWRVIEQLESEISYEHMGPIQKIPEDF